MLVRNPFNPQLVTRYRLDPAVVDLLSFCTKNPAPMLDRIHELDAFRVFFMVTITPYGREIEPEVPDPDAVIRSFAVLSAYAGRNAVSWRYDPVFVSERYSVELHKREFARIARALKPYTDQCVVSFLDLYEKTRKNFPEARTVSAAEQEELIASFAETAAELDLQIHLCLEDRSLVRPHVDADGCFSQGVVEKAIGEHLLVPHLAPARAGCTCLLGADIGAYNTCLHGCRYCYANYDQAVVQSNYRQHDPDSPLLVGHLLETDILHEAKQTSWIDPQLRLEDLLQGSGMSVSQNQIRKDDR